jgi:hypothetical protein
MKLEAEKLPIPLPRASAIKGVSNCAGLHNLPFQQVTAMHAQNLGQLIKRLEGDIAFSAFNASNPCAMHAAKVGKLFLRPAAFGTKLPHHSGDDEIGILPLHADSVPH